MLPTTLSSSRTAAVRRVGNEASDASPTQPPSAPTAPGMARPARKRSPGRAVRPASSRSESSRSAAVKKAGAMAAYIAGAAARNGRSQSSAYPGSSASRRCSRPCPAVPLFRQDGGERRHPLAADDGRRGTQQAWIRLSSARCECRSGSSQPAEPAIAGDELRHHPPSSGRAEQSVSPSASARPSMSSAISSKVYALSPWRLRLNRWPRRSGATACEPSPPAGEPRRKSSFARSESVHEEQRPLPGARLGYRQPDVVNLDTPLTHVDRNPISPTARSDAADTGTPKVLNLYSEAIYKRCLPPGARPRRA